jgi:hypothetical protein
MHELPEINALDVPDFPMMKSVNYFSVTSSILRDDVPQRNANEIYDHLDIFQIDISILDMSCQLIISIFNQLMIIQL